MNAFQYFLLIAIVLAGGAGAFLVQQYNRQYLQLILSFSGAYILGITVLHLMPIIYSHSGPTPSMGLWVLGGFFLQLVLEQFSSGVEHGHIHQQKNMRRGALFSIMAGLCLHAFIEGLPLHNYQQLHAELHPHHPNGDHFLLAIILHKAPAAFALVLLLLFSSVRRGVVWLSLIIFALMTPSGAWLSSILDFNSAQLRILVAIVVGSFLHIATTILFEMDNTQHHKVSVNKLIAIILGSGMAVLTIF